jgi:hypothetical protein
MVLCRHHIKNAAQLVIVTRRTDSVALALKHVVVHYNALGGFIAAAKTKHKARMEHISAEQC